MTDAAEVILKSSPHWQGLTTTGKRLDNGDLEPGEPLIIRCHDRCNSDKCTCLHVTVGICQHCLEDFDRVLTDVPWLLDDLDIAIAGEDKFVEHGYRAGTLDESDIGSSRHPAVAAQARLTLALFGDGTAAHPGAADWFDVHTPTQIARQLGSHLARLADEPRLPVLAHDISAAAKRAHHVIDAPKDLVFYGPCPDCHRDILQERIHRDDTETRVTCRYPSCGYAKTLDEHYKKILDSNEDRWMTVSELVSAITSGGELVNRNQIYYWERKSGLARELRTRAKWVNGDLVTDEVWCFRLGDVRQRAADAANKTGKMTA